MTKYSDEIKLKAVEMVIKEHKSPLMVSKELLISEPPIRRWVKRFEVHGPEGLMIKNKSYTGEFKMHVINYMYKHKLSLNGVAAQFGIPSDTTVGKWERDYLEGGLDALYRDNRGRKKMGKKKSVKKLNPKIEEDLIAEVQRLRMENEYLKKLNALVQEREKSVKKIKF